MSRHSSDGSQRELRNRRLTVIGLIFVVVVYLAALFVMPRSSLAFGSVSSQAITALNITLLLIMLRFFMSLGDCTNSLSKITSHIKTGKNVIAAIQPSRVKKNGAPLTRKIERIECNQVSFQYDAPVLSGLDLTLQSSIPSRPISAIAGARSRRPRHGSRPRTPGRGGGRSPPEP